MKMNTDPTCSRTADQGRALSISSRLNHTITLVIPEATNTDHYNPQEHTRAQVMTQTTAIHVGFGDTPITDANTVPG